MSKVQFHWMQSSSWLSSTEFTRIHGFNEHVDVYNTNVVTTKTFTASKYYLNWWNHTHTHGNGVTCPNIEEETDRPHGNVVPPLWSSVAVHVSDNKQSGHWTPTCSTCVLLTYLITLVWQPSNGQMLFLALVQHASVGLTKLIGSACLSVGLHLKSRAIHIVLNVSP